VTEGLLPKQSAAGTTSFAQQTYRAAGISLSEAEYRVQSTYRTANGNSRHRQFI